MVEQVNRLLSDAIWIEAGLKETQQQSKRLDQKITNLLDLAEVHPSADVLSRLRQRETERALKRADLARLQR